MEAVKPLEKQINHYLSRLNTREQRVVLSVIKTIAGEDDEWWNDKEYMAEMDRRYEEMVTGKDKGILPEQLEKRIKKAYKESKVKSHVS